MVSEVEEWKNVTLRWIWEYQDVNFGHGVRFEEWKICGRRRAMDAGFFTSSAFSNHHVSMVFLYVWTTRLYYSLVDVDSSLFLLVLCIYVQALETF